MQKTHLQRHPHATGFAPLSASDPAYAEITRLLHTREAVPVGGNSGIRNRTFRPSLAALPAQISRHSYAP
jgi:hypothetical protein